MSAKELHENYQEDNCYNSNGVWYNNYFFPIDFKLRGRTTVLTLYGSTTYLNRCVGYCNKKKFYLTEKQMKHHQCRRKQCKFFLRTPYSENYWDKEDQKKLMKKMKKEKSFC